VSQRSETLAEFLVGIPENHMENLGEANTEMNIKKFDCASSLICGNKMPTRCNRGFYFWSYCFFNIFRAPLCPSAGAEEYYTVVAACGISGCKDIKNNFVN